MDTYCIMQVPGDASVRDSMTQAFDRLEEIDKKFNALNPTSPVYRFNHENSPITDPEIVGLVQTALDVSAKSDGALDITVFPLVDLWGFYGSTPHLPGDGKIQACLKHVGWKNLAIEGGKLIKHRPDMALDFGAIAKGYGVGEAVKVLKNCGIRSALVDAGGDLYMLGTRYGKPWHVGIREPRGTGVFGGMKLTDRSMATSGDYERYFIKAGVRYHHIFDPKTGYPAHGLISATAITPDPTLADAYSTALFVLGAERALKLVATTPDLECVLVTEAGRVLISPRLQKSMAMTDLTLAGQTGK